MLRYEKVFGLLFLSFHLANGVVFGQALPGKDFGAFSSSFQLNGNTITGGSSTCNTGDRLKAKMDYFIVSPAGIEPSNYVILAIVNQDDEWRESSIQQMTGPGVLSNSIQVEYVVAAGDSSTSYRPFVLHFDNRNIAYYADWVKFFLSFVWVKQ